MSELIWLSEELTIEERVPKQRALDYYDQQRSHRIQMACNDVIVVGGVKNYGSNYLRLYLKTDRNDCAQFLNAVATMNLYDNRVLQVPLQIICSTCRDPEYGERDHHCFIEKVGCTLQGYTDDNEAIVQCEVLEW